ncbi:MAG: 23S rRNA (adenine(2503)-C(2))-methyltransferase RlmN [Patescibacteria group bacterium]|nr:23S rRNA (adenine(2503)-C(2))-methyltransferase RlmN [Patescibacteria group bacterium]
MIYKPEFEQFFEEIGEKKYRLKQIYQAVHKDLVASWDDVTTIPLSLREQLQEKFPFSSLSVSHSVKSQDGTEKVLFRTHDDKFIEGVLLRQKGRVTICMSTQIGCAMGCHFCATGKMGLARNLTVQEMVDQILYFARHVKPIGERINNVVLMGMGEPFQNYENVMDALGYLNDDHGIAIGQRHLTISTCGVVPKIKALADDGHQYNLAISLHAPEQRLRKKIMPVAQMHDFDELMDAIKYYQEKTNRRIFYEYTLMAGINDSVDHARALVELLKPQAPLAHVNILSWNGNPYNEFSAPSKDAIRAFQDVLVKGGVPSTYRHSKGDDISAACGQLAAEQSGE